LLTLATLLLLASVAPALAVSVSGTVFGDTNADGVRDSGENGLSGWTVRVYDVGQSPAAVVGSDVTDTNGDYSIGGLAVGD
jgi:hypothetical protein